MLVFYWNTYAERRDAAVVVNNMNNAMMQHNETSSSPLSVLSLSSGNLTNDKMSIDVSSLDFATLSNVSNCSSLMSCSCLVCSEEQLAT